MKKILVIAMMVVLNITASAQGTWSVSHRQADELKGQTAQDVYMYEAPGIGTVVVWDWKKPDFRLITDKGIFHQELVQGVGLCVPIQVGFRNFVIYCVSMVSKFIFLKRNKPAPKLC